MTEPLLSPAFLFRFAAPCRFRKALGSARGVALGEQFVLPCFGELEGKQLMADVRAAWNEEGVAFEVVVRGKKQPPWCRKTRIEDSDGLQVWMDTRDAHNIHRASRFCHRFAFLPSGSGQGMREPVATDVPINRAKERPKPVEAGVLQIKSKLHRDGYTLQAFVPARAITGYDPQEHPKLGFSYAIVDRELGWQTFSVGPEFPFQEDPSLWGTLELVPE